MNSEATAFIPSGSLIRPSDLRCEFGDEPCGIDTARPRLFWRLTGDGRGARQTAYQILAASRLDLLEQEQEQEQGDLWDTGKIVSSDSMHLAYEGEPLRSSQQVFWTVRSWDENDRVSEWALPTSWTMGILQTSDWQACWVSARDALRNVTRKFAGYHSSDSASADEVKWVEINMAQSLEIDAIRLHPVTHKGVKNYGFPEQFKVELANWEGIEKPRLVIERTAEDFPDRGDQPVELDGHGTLARTIRISATRLAEGTSGFCFALSQIEIISRGYNVTDGTDLSASDSRENPTWSISALTDRLGGDSKYETMLLARRFSVRSGLVRALAHSCGLGHYEISFNGEKSGTDLLSPGWTNYRKTRLYDTREVTSLLTEGDNTISLLLGNGFFNLKGGRYTKYKGTFGPLQAIAQLRLEYDDGTVEIIGTDDQWAAAPGPITFSCMYGGEDYDARLGACGVRDLATDAREWEPAMILGEPGETLRGYCSAPPPIRAWETLHPDSVRELTPGVAIYDFGQNAAVMPRIRAFGPAGSYVKITPAELLHPDGSLDRQSCGGGEAYWKFTLSGAGEETWSPRFFYQGCRYLEVECLPAEGSKEIPRVAGLEVNVVQSASAPVGEFACSSDLFNRIRNLVRWAQRSNLMHVITDCPHREKLGWLEQYHLNGPALRYEFDLGRLMAKGLNDMEDAQLENGLVTDVAPEYAVFSGGFRDSPEWGSAFIVTAWQQYEWTGDIQSLRRHYTGMKRYVAYLASRAREHIVFHGLGDWFDIGPEAPGPAQLTPPALTATAFFYYDALLLAKIASLLEQPDDAQRYQALASTIHAAFNKAFLNPSTGQYATGSQCANAIALEMQFADPAHRSDILQALVSDIQGRENSITAGDVGYRYVLLALAGGKRSDVVWSMNNQSDRLGYGYQLLQGATSLAEAWDARRESSQNHFMLGQITEWFYHDLAGIGQVSGSSAFQRILIRPQPVGDIHWAEATCNVLPGKIACRWEISDETFRLALTIPANTSAEVHIPTSDGAQIREGDNLAEKAEGVRFLRMVDDAAVFEVNSGTYAFASPYVSS